jgi:hypothetical protein
VAASVPRSSRRPPSPVPPPPDANPNRLIGVAL